MYVYFYLFTWTQLQLHIWDVFRIFVWKVQTETVCDARELQYDV